MILGIKSIYEKAGFTDGKRVLVEGLWPRGVRHSTANIEFWARDTAPSNAIRLKLIAHPEWWPRFKELYLKELEKNNSTRALIAKTVMQDVTFVYSTRSDNHNNAVVLKWFVEHRLKDMEKERAKKLNLLEKEKMRILAKKQKEEAARIKKQNRR